MAEANRLKKIEDEQDAVEAARVKSMARIQARKKQ